MTDTTNDQAGPGGPEVVRSVDRAFGLLEVLGAGASPMGLSRLAQEAGVAKATVHRLLQPLLSKRYVTRSGRGYVLGERLYELAHHSEGEVHSRLARVLRPYLMELHQRTGAAVGVGMLDRGKVLFVDMLYDHSHSPFVTRSWDRGPLHCTAAGKLLLAYDFPSLALTVRSELEPFTDHTIVSPADLLQRLKTVRHQSIAYAQDEFAVGRIEIAAPVFNGQRDVVATVTAIGHAGRFNRSAAVVAIRRVAAAASQTLRQEKLVKGAS